jgi:hypothetical protein
MAGETAGREPAGVVSVAVASMAAQPPVASPPFWPSSNCALKHSAIWHGQDPPGRGPAPEI